MKKFQKYAILIFFLTLSLLSCSFLSDITSLIQGTEDLLPLAPIGGTPVRVVVNVAFDYRETFSGSELVYSSGEWVHTQEGRLMNTIGWLPHHNEIDAAYGSGREHCYYDWGQADPSVPHWTVQWSGNIWFDNHERLTAEPLIHLAVYDDEVLVLYAPPQGFYYPHPGSPNDCQNLDPVPAHNAIFAVFFNLDEMNAERAPDADTATETVIQDGIVLLRIPLDTLHAGIKETNAVSLSGSHTSAYGTYDYGLSITLTLDSTENN